MMTNKLTQGDLSALPCLHEGRYFTVYLQTQSEFGRPIVIKSLRAEAGENSAKRLANEFRLTANLRISGIRRPRKQFLVGGHPAIALDYIEGKTLEETHVRQRQPLAKNLQVAIAITTILDELHQQQVIHRNLASAHIIVSSPLSAVTLIGFGDALIAKEIGVTAETDLSYSMLAYISPEQTGRINRRVDHRADLYSLGAILYEVFTGKPLFNVKEMSDWIYSHLARNPLPPYKLNPELPKTISDLIIRLLAKNPDQRYQSAFGVQADLKEMQQQLLQTGQIGEMALGRSDYSNMFQLPDRLYDREKELAILKTAIKNAINGCGSFVLISGQAGSGKTSLVEALRHYAAEQGVYFIVGTHESSQRHVPYTGIRQAFGELINLILTGSLQQLAQWKSDLLDISGGNGGLLLDMLPQLKLVIGQQPPAPELAPEQAHHRFHYLFRSFVLASSRQELPLVLFLDNLQWADLATIQVLNMLLPGIDTLPIVIMAAYRDDEVGSGHPIAALINPLTQQENKTQTLSLKPFTVETVNRIIADALKTDAADTLQLAHLVQEKTGGNPLYIRQFTQSLHENGLLVFNAKKRLWNWKMDAIRQQPIISSVAEMMTHKFGKLPEPTRSILAMAACIGTQFRIHMLASLTEMTEAEITDRLHPAIEAGLLAIIETLPEPGSSLDVRSEVIYVFPHDRVCQAAIALLPQKQRRMNHLHIGRLLLKQIPEESMEDWVFEIADQFNEGFQYIKDEQEQQQLVALNLMAGRKARRAAAHQAAIRYLSMGIGLLPADRWKSPEIPTLELFIEAIEAEYLSANFDRAALLSDEVLKNTGDLFMRLRVYELKILFLTAQNQNLSAIKAGMAALEELGIELTEKVSEDESQQLAALSGRVDTLGHLPAMNELQHLASLRIMMHLAAPVERAKPHLLRSLIGKMVLLSAAHGNSPMAAFAYGWYGAILCGTTGDIETGYRFGRLSQDILHQFPSAELRTRVTLLFNAYIRHWKEPIHESTAHLQVIFRQGIETGDLEYTSLGAVHYCGYQLCTGEPLENICAKQLEYLQTMERWRLPFQSQLMRIWLQITTNLREGSGDPTKLTGEFFDESKYLPQRLGENNSLLEFIVLCSRTMLQYLFGNYAAATLSGRQAEEYTKSVQGLYYRVNHTFHYALALLAYHDTTSSARSAECLDLVAPLLDRLRRWAVLAPMNFAHKLALVEAEHARASGDNGRALESFNQAIRLARENGQLMDEALASEREAAFYSALGRDDIAALALRKAVDRYRSWGAQRKVEMLEQHFKTHAHRELTLLDTATMLKALQMLSQEVHLEQLLEKLMRIVIENAGAEKGLLLLNNDTGLMIKARGSNSAVETMQAIPVENSGEAALSVVNYVMRTHSEVVLGDAQRDPTFGTDEYITEHRTQSLLCLPIIYQGKLSGLLYLENNLASDVFTVDRLELLKALVSQAAISIENATLYEELESNITALRESEEKFRVIFNHTFQFIGVLDTDGNVLQANRTALQFAGVSEEEVIGKPFWETPWWAHSVELQQRLKRAVREAKTGLLVRFEATHPSSNGQTNYVDFSLMPVTDTDGHVTQLIPEGRNITERKQAEEELLRYKEHLEETVRQRTDELRLARDEAEAANKAKSAFLANMSHELRTPLNAILGFSHMMQRDENLSKNQQETLNIINNSGEHLLKLINDVLEIAKIEAGKLQLVISTFDLHALVLEVADMMRLRAQQRGLQLVLDQSSELPRYINADEARLRQIFVNLISNAVKFTEEGSVTIRLGVKNNHQRQLLFEIEDTGPGISEVDQQRLFKPFEQLPEGRMHIGTGLGLSIVQHFVMLMGGSIVVESKIDEGSLFRVVLPLNEAAEAEITGLGEKKRGEVSGLAPGQPSYRILVAEDQKDNQLLLAKLMTDIGMEVKVANNGKECIEIFKKWKPDLIWMDRRMSVMDGIEATRQIRRMPDGKKVKIIAVTASAFKEQKQELLDAGMDGYIRKPFLFNEIYDSMAQKLGVKFTYHEKVIAPKITQKVLTPKIMHAVSEEQREELRLAIESLDRDSIDRSISRIAVNNTELGRALSHLANEFDYPTILSAIEAVTEKEQQNE